MNNDARTEMYIYKGLSQKSHNPNFVSKLGLRCGGDSWTRTNDPIDVNDVLYRLSHATTFSGLKNLPPRTEDGVLNMEKIETGKMYAPEDYQEYIIAGGNHAQFGNYGEQRGDGPANISSEEQQEMTVRYIIQNKQ